MGIQQFLGLFGLSVQSLVFLGLVVIVWSWLCIFVGTRLAGLLGSLGRAFGVLLLGGLFGIPLGFIVGLLTATFALGETAQAVSFQAIAFAAQTGAIKILYKAPLARAVLAFLVASSLSMLGSIALLYAVF